MAKKLSKAEPKHEYNEDQEVYILSLIHGEYSTSKSNASMDIADFEAIVDLFECQHSEKNYEWNSDIFYPEFPTIELTQCSNDAKNFKTRDFVDVVLEGQGKDNIKCRAAKKIINKCLNVRDIYYFHKFIRAKMINRFAGCVYAVCWWEQNVEEDAVIGYQSETYDTGDIDEMSGGPIYGTRQNPVKGQQVKRDTFNFEVLDPRNCFTDNSYTYSIQDKPFFIIRAERTLEQLKGEAKEKKYFNLDLVEALKAPEETETSRETYNKLDPKQKTSKRPTKPFDILTRYGKMWAIKKGEKIEPGWDEYGEVKDSAELIECVTVMAFSGSSKVLIGFESQRHMTKNGRTYRPLLRGLCYIHPSKDTGISDGTIARELQIGLNDTINVSNDRVMLATFPTLAVRRLNNEDNDTLYFEPEHFMLLDDPANDMQEIRIRDNIQGAMAQSNLFMSGMEKGLNVFPTTMGSVPGKDVTATAVAGAEGRSDTRASYKDLCFEYTFAVDQYFMMLQMAWQFMNAETAMKILGEDVWEFDPEEDYAFTPVSANIETDYSKDKKVQRYDGVMGRLGAFKDNPKIMPIIAHIVGRQCELLGDEFSQLQPMIEALAKTPMPQEGGAGPDVKDQKDAMTQNQSGMPVGALESGVRGM